LLFCITAFKFKSVCIFQLYIKKRKVTVNKCHRHGSTKEVQESFVAAKLEIYAADSDCEKLPDIL
jgi:hypothetical protein